MDFPPWVFYTFFKLYKWYQIAQRTTFISICISPVNKLPKQKHVLYTFDLDNLFTGKH